MKSVYTVLYFSKVLIEPPPTRALHTLTSLHVRTTLFYFFISLFFARCLFAVLRISFRPLLSGLHTTEAIGADPDPQLPASQAGLKVLPLRVNHFRTTSMFSNPPAMEDLLKTKHVQHPHARTPPHMCVNMRPPFHMGIIYSSQSSCTLTQAASNQQLS